MNNKSLGYLFIFSLGAAIGSAVTWKICKEKYEQIAREEIASVKEVFSNRLRDIDSEDQPDPEVPDVTEDEETTTAYEQMARSYDTASTTTRSDRKEDSVSGPCIIDPDEYGEIEEYDCITYSYYADGVLTDEVDEPVSDIEDTVGEEALSRLGKPDKYGNPVDEIYVRNDNTRCYYEILLDLRNYTDVCGR